MRQWARILLTFTRPYLGTASSMSNTLAVSTYSGGSSSSEWIERRPAFRSRLSSARLTRISFALARASIRWFKDLSGAMEVVDDGLPVAVDIGGESTRQRRAIKTKAANSPAPQPEVDSRRAWCMVAVRVCRDFGPIHHRRSRYLQTLDAARRSGWRSGWRRPGQARSVRAPLSELPGDSSRGRRVAEALGADGHERGPDVDQVAGVRRALNPAHAHDWDPHRGCDGGDLCQGDRAHGGPRQAARAASQT